ncbi:YidC/Oxa1 family membrane protein insertase, partial [Brachyspira hyodysenteriae]
GTLGLLIQIPFFMAAYNFVHSLSGLSGQSFLFIKDLSKPDALIHIGNISINLLPFLMTLFSLLAGFVYSRKLKFKESLPLYVVSLIFLFLLYNSPSGLLFYWTINCLFSFIKNIIIEFKLYEIFVRNRYKLLKAYNIFFIIV